jgi:hypothetical protein
VLRDGMAVDRLDPAGVYAARARAVVLARRGARGDPAEHLPPIQAVEVVVI